MAKPANGFFFNLANTLTGNTQFTSHLFESMSLSIAKPKTQL